MDWNSASDWLYEVKSNYEDIGIIGNFAINLTINPLIERYEEGERTQELYDEIIELE